ncbi:MAG: AMP-binding protein [Rhodanobacteraceae bacterium]
MAVVFETTEVRAPQRLLPLLRAADPARTIAWRNGRDVRVAEFLLEVGALAARLPEAPAAINLCEDRYAFLVAFAALSVRGQTNLLPPSRAPHAIDEVLATHPGSYTLGDVALDPAPPHYLRFEPFDLTNGDATLNASVDGDLTVAVAYTSGSTGVPKANPKRWEKIGISSAHNNALLLGLAGAPYHVVATVPPQHMYGLEFSVLLPLFAEASVHAARPFFPCEVTRALEEIPAPRVLVTTPVHLRALVEHGEPLPPLAAIVSATAPMPPELARAAEKLFATPVQEVFGSTETCVIAHRRTAAEELWTLYPGVALHPQPDGAQVDAPQLMEPVVLADLVDVSDCGRFRLCGRNADLLEIAGKRASLGDLTKRLLAVPGVRDGVVFQLDEPEPNGVRRIAALAVAPGLTSQQILDALRLGLDPVFLPRPLKRVDELPRSETSKLPRAALMEMLRR